MKIESALQDDHQIKLTVDIDDDTLLAAKKKAAKRLAKRTKIPGFRPGKAPYPVIIKHIGEGSVLEEAIDIIIKEQYPKVIKEANIDPYGPGTLENVNSVEPLEMEFIVPLSPEVDIGESLNIRKPFDPPEITGQDVEQVLNNMLERHAELGEVERPAQESDLVNIRLYAFKTSDADAVDSEVFPERSVPIIIRSDEKVDPKEPNNNDKNNKEWPFPGFSSNLIGMEKDIAKEITHQFSDEAPDPFKNNRITFSISIENVQSRNLPDLNDEFAKNTGGYPDLKSMRADILTNLDRQNLEMYEQSYDEEILNEAVEISKFKYPPQALEHEINDVVTSLKNRLESQNLDLDIYMKTRNINEQELREEVTPVAKERLEKTLFLYEIAKQDGIAVDDKKVKTEAQQTLDYLSQSLPYKDARKLSNENIVANLEWNIRADLLARSAMVHFRDICSGKIDDDNNNENDNQQVNVLNEEVVNEIHNDTDHVSNTLPENELSKLDIEDSDDSSEENF